MHRITTRSDSARLARSPALAALLFSLLVLAPSQASAFTTERMASGLSRPVYATAPVGDSRLFIVEQGGLIRILSGTTVAGTPFLDVSTDLVGTISGNDERGLLGLAFPADYATSGLFYINYTVIASGAARVTRIVRFQVSGDPNVADAGSAEVILEIAQPFSNHNGGHIAFGPDGFLYIGMGDGGSAGDPLDNAQTDSTLLGKMLRIDVSGGLGSGYSIPLSNPHVGVGDPLDEIWAKGMRNPYRFSFDRTDGDLYLADVGQNLIEEINVEDESDAGGRNYGWRIMEGNSCFNPVSCSTTGLTLPVHEYTHGGSPFRCSVTGGYVYRGSDVALQGHYFFADFCSDQIWTFLWDGSSGITSLEDRTDSFTPDVGAVGEVASFAEDGVGELYIVDRGVGANSGEIFKIQPSVFVPVPIGNRVGTVALMLALMASAFFVLRRRRVEHEF